MHIKKQTIKQNKTKQNKNRLVHEGIYVQFYYFFKFKIDNCWGIRNQVKWEFHKTRRYLKVVNKIYMYHHHHFYRGFHPLDSLIEKKVFGL